MNNFKKIEQEQNTLIVDNVTKLTRFSVPKLGWIKTLRKAFSMSGATLARRMGLQRSSLAYLEQSERQGSITLKKLQDVASAMDCELIYALVPMATADNPSPTIDDIIHKQSEAKARFIVKRASTQMMLESQELTKVSLKNEVERLKRQLINEMPRGFWEKDS